MKTTDCAIFYRKNNNIIIIVGSTFIKNRWQPILLIFICTHLHFYTVLVHFQINRLNS